MKPKLITDHKDYLLLVDTSVNLNSPGNYDQPRGIWYLTEVPQMLFQTTNRTPSIASGKGWCYKLIGHRPLSDNAPLLEGVPLLPELTKQGEDVEVLFKAYLFSSISGSGLNDYQYKEALKNFEAGYKAANQDRGYGEVVEKALRASLHFQDTIRGMSVSTNVNKERHRLRELLNEAIQSLSAPVLPVDFEPEIIPNDFREMMLQHGQIITNHEFKTILNDKGVPVLQGKYIY